MASTEASESSWSIASAVLPTALLSGRDFINAGRDLPRRIELTRIEFGVTAGQEACELHRFLADIPLHDQRQEPTDHDDRAERAEDVANRITHRDVGLHGLDQLGRQPEFADGIACRADDRRLGEPAGSESGRHAAIQAEHPCSGQNAQQADETHHERGSELVQRAPVQRVEELRTALESDGVDEQRKEYILDAAVDIDAELSNDDADQQRSGDAAQERSCRF